MNEHLMLHVIVQSVFQLRKDINKQLVNKMSRSISFISVKSSVSTAQFPREIKSSEKSIFFLKFNVDYYV